MKKIFYKYWKRKNERGNSNSSWKRKRRGNGYRRQSGFAIHAGIRAGRCVFCEKVRGQVKGLFGIGASKNED